MRRLSEARRSRVALERRYVFKAAWCFTVGKWVTYIYNLYVCIYIYVYIYVYIYIHNIQ